jgi:hypothetical protein
MNEYKLTDQEVAELARYSEAIAELARQRDACLRLIARQQSLDGDWQFAGDRLVRKGTE